MEFFLVSGLFEKSLEKLEDIRIIIRIFGIYDTVSSYGEIDEMGGDNVYTKGVAHLVNSFFTDDEAELNLQNMGGIFKSLMKWFENNPDRVTKKNIKVLVF